jgi:hypothetical protein
MEVTLKRLDRYPDIFKGYAERRVDRFNVVFYVCGSAPVRDTLRKLAGDTRRFCFALWEDFVQRGANTPFANSYEAVTPAELA